MNSLKSLFFIKFGLTTAFACFLAASSASASIVSPQQTFLVSGTFTDNATLAGTFTIQNGSITSGSLSVSTVTGIFTLDNGGGGSYNDGVWANVDFSDGGATLWLDLVLPKGTKNLNQYTGGPLCDNSGNCDDQRSGYLPATVNADDGQDPPLASGRVTLSSATPEPTSTALLGAGLVALSLTFRRRFANVTK